MHFVAFFIINNAMNIRCGKTKLKYVFKKSYRRTLSNVKKIFMLELYLTSLKFYPGKKEKQVFGKFDNKIFIFRTDSKKE